MSAAPKNTGKIYFAAAGWDPEIWMQAFAKYAPDREIVTEIKAGEEASIDYALVWKQKRGSLTNLPNLKVIFSLGAGVDHVFHDDQVPNLPIVRTVSPDLTMRMTEYVVWQVLDHHRLGPQYRAQQLKKIWREDRRQPAANEVNVGIMGLGVLGRDAADKLKHLGFNVSGWSRRPQDVTGVNTYHGKDGLSDFLKQVDILVCLLPLTPDTKGILSMSVFGRMKEDGPLGAPILINAGRGGLQNEADIQAALERGLLSAASLDVFETEPLPEASPLWGNPKITITPHAAASSSANALTPEIVKMITDYERDGTLTNLVDREKQY